MSFIGNPDLVARLRNSAPLFEVPASAFFGGGTEGHTRFSLAHPFTQATETAAG